MRTIDEIKKTRDVPEELHEKRKEYTRIKKLILKALEDEPKSIPQISLEIQMPIEVVTFYLMSLRKFGEIEVDEIDDMDEYFLYKRKDKTPDQ